MGSHLKLSSVGTIRPVSVLYMTAQSGSGMKKFLGCVLTVVDANLSAGNTALKVRGFMQSLILIP